MIFSKPSWYCITKVKDHKVNKERILSQISKSDYEYPNTDITDYYSFISNTDYTVRQNTWFQYALSERDQLAYSKFLYDKFQKKDAWITFAWFNQYHKNSGSEHAYHNHYCDEQPNDLTNIYYVQLEDKRLRTILKDPLTGKEIIPRVKEGQILTFDAKIEHRSPRNYTNTRKTVLSFNTKF